MTAPEPFTGARNLMPADSWMLTVSIAMMAGFVGGAAEALQSIFENRERTFHSHLFS
jgi:hypothetical protein